MKIFNSLTQNIQEFKTLKEKSVKMYVCGITPYDTTHLGHAFTYVFFDVLQRYLKFKGYRINYVQNVTDIDDDILKKANQVGQNWKTLGNFWTKRFLEDMKALNVETPTHFIKATDSIDKVIQIILNLSKKGLIYQKNGNVYFEIKKFKNYGKLSRCTRNQMLILAKERGGNPDDPFKIDPLDFLLWQKSKPSEPIWDSPWGKGRPGWHIECSAMIHNYLGEQIDIHGGGKDLMYPHHDSEIAQSESYTVKSPFVKFWIHVCMLLYQGEKMAKSLGNLVMIKDLAKIYSGNAVRWLLLSHHYRSPWEYKEEDLKRVQENVELVESVIARNEGGPSKRDKQSNSSMQQFIQIMDQDMDTPKALQLLLKSKSKKIYEILGFKLYSDMYKFERVSKKTERSS